MKLNNLKSEFLYQTNNKVYSTMTLNNLITSLFIFYTKKYVSKVIKF